MKIAAFFYFSILNQQGCVPIKKNMGREKGPAKRYCRKKDRKGFCRYQGWRKNADRHTCHCG